jgi:hypothetical protein
MLSCSTRRPQRRTKQLHDQQAFFGSWAWRSLLPFLLLLLLRLRQQPLLLLGLHSRTSWLLCQRNGRLRQSLLVRMFLPFRRPCCLQLGSFVPAAVVASPGLHQQLGGCRGMHGGHPRTMHVHRMLCRLCGGALQAVSPAYLLAIPRGFRGCCSLNTVALHCR